MGFMGVKLPGSQTIPSETETSLTWKTTELILFHEIRVFLQVPAHKKLQDTHDLELMLYVLICIPVPGRQMFTSFN